MNVSVLLICFNRPEYVAQMIDALRKCNVSKLFVFKDGPRPGNVIDEQASIEIERLISQIDWDCELVTNYMQNNLGCGYGPYSAISWAFQYTEELVILEDDCIPTMSFFKFCEEMLDRYRDDTRVSLISGFSRLTDPELFSGYDYIFSQYGVTWGWATWKRSWIGFDMQLRNLSDFFDMGGFKTQFSTRREADFFNYRYHYFKKDSNLYKHVWDIQFGLHSRSNGALRIVPSQSLIKYIGEDGTHYNNGNNNSDVFSIIVSNKFNFASYPTSVNITSKYDEIYFDRYVYSEYRFIFRVMNKIKRMLFNR